MIGLCETKENYAVADPSLAYLSTWQQKHCGGELLFFFISTTQQHQHPFPIFGSDSNPKLTP